MKKFITAFLLVSFNSVMAAEVQDCVINGHTLKNIAVPGPIVTLSIDDVLKSNKDDASKVKEIRNLMKLAVTNSSHAPGLCKLATSLYKNVAEEKCVKAATSRDLAENLIDEADMLDVSLECKIGVNAKLLMEFSM